ncbi:inverse autotransporter beta domain-containing protein [Yokenella regensburgei]|uniref:inverse autotransporter beta domain-containing protein n=1 Tax=Yokenella regensburgei TaxID=158877 RepID=UPI0027D95B7A|nr:inverse autotransporter beta domain-containing protein [Yokenella regensburgei]MDQ4429029.1 inverse autotransporter beta domain-containing protein [Yokenella regensburgei]
MNELVSRSLVYSIAISQAFIPVVLATEKLPQISNDFDVGNEKSSDMVNKEVERWLASNSITVSNAIKNTSDVTDYARSYAHSYSQSLGNLYLSEGVRTLSPAARFRGGVTLDENFEFKSVDADLLIPIYETTSSILFGQLGLRTHDKSSFDGRTFLNTGVGYRHDVDSWMLGINVFVDSDVKYNNIRGSLGAEVFRDNLSFAGNYYFPLTDWKESKAYELYDERPAYGFDIRAKGFLPAYPHLGTELTYEQYYGDKVDILGNGKLTSDPYAASADIIYKPVPLLEITAGYKDANSAGTETRLGLNVNYVFGQRLSEQLDASKVMLPDNGHNRTEFVSRNYNIVMEYREQESRITLSSRPVSGLAETAVTLTPSVNSRYPIVSYQWTGDVEVLAGIADTKTANTTLTLPALPLDSIEGKLYGLYLTATDSRGVSATSERIPVMVGINNSTFTSYIELMNKDASIKDDVYQVPVSTTNEVVLEWRFARATDGKQVYVKPESFKYESVSQNVTSKSLGGSYIDGQWVERVKVSLDTTKSVTPQASQAEIKMIAGRKRIVVQGPGEAQPTIVDVEFLHKSNTSVDNISRLSVDYTPGTEVLNGSTVAPVVGSTLSVKAECGPQDCSADYQYTWQISADNANWTDIQGVTSPQWLMPATHNGKSLQGYHVRVQAHANP